MSSPAPHDPVTGDVAAPPLRWYHGVTRYQWLVLIIASAGWVFDVYEGQIFGITSNKLLDAFNPATTTADRAAFTKYYRDVFLSIFLAGSMFGGLLFGMLGDRWGRRPTMIVTILMYSVFSGLTYFATSLPQVAVLRFLVAMGVGGEWAVAAALVFEVFPKHARPQASSIFHASSTLGTWMASIVGWLVAEQWRYAYLVGVLPALLILWVRAKVEEPKAWVETGGVKKSDRGSFRILLGDPRWRSRAWLGVLLAAIGLGNYWGVIVAGQELAKYVQIEDDHVDPKTADQNAILAYGLVQSTGGGFGLLAFGPLAARFGRRRTFAVLHVLAFLIVPIACFVPQSFGQLLCILPFYGAFTLAMHAGYAVYFPELFPTHLRALGASFCFNGGRLLGAVMLLASATLKAQPGMTLPVALSILSSSYLLGLIVIAFLPETKNQALPE